MTRGLLLLFVLPAGAFSPGRACRSREAIVMRETIRDRLNADMKTAMKAKEKERLAAIRSMTAAIKQKEVDDRGVEVDDAMTIDLLSKLLPDVAQRLSLTTSRNSDGSVEAETYTGILVLEDLVFDAETGRASLPPSAFDERSMALPRLPSNPYQQ